MASKGKKQSADHVAKRIIARVKNGSFILSDEHKQNCNPINLITLCHGCHTKTNLHREYWINYFKNKTI